MSVPPFFSQTYQAADAALDNLAQQGAELIDETREKINQTLEEERHKIAAHAAQQEKLQQDELSELAKKKEKQEERQDIQRKLFQAHLEEQQKKLEQDETIFKQRMAQRKTEFQKQIKESEEALELHKKNIPFPTIVQHPTVNPAAKQYVFHSLKLYGDSQDRYSQPSVNNQKHPPIPFEISQQSSSNPRIQPKLSHLTPLSGIAPLQPLKPLPPFNPKSQ